MTRVKLIFIPNHIVYIHPKRAANIQLKYQMHNKDKLQEHVCIIPDKQFMHTKKLLTIPLSVAKKTI